MVFPGTKISTRPIFFERNHSKRFSVENSQGRFPSEISRLSRRFPPPLLLFLGREKKQIPDDSSRDPFDPLLGGHDSPLSLGHVNSPSQKGHQAEVPGWWFSLVFFGVPKLLSTRCFFWGPERKQRTKERISGANVWHQPKQCKNYKGTTSKLPATFASTLVPLILCTQNWVPSNDPWKTPATIEIESTLILPTWDCD